MTVAASTIVKMNDVAGAITAKGAITVMSATEEIVTAIDMIETETIVNARLVTSAIVTSATMSAQDAIVTKARGADLSHQQDPRTIAAGRLDHRLRNRISRHLDYLQKKATMLTALH